MQVRYSVKNRKDVWFACDEVILYTLIPALFHHCSIVPPASSSGSNLILIFSKKPIIISSQAPTPTIHPTITTRSISDLCDLSLLLRQCPDPATIQPRSCHDSATIHLRPGIIRRGYPSKVICCGQASPSHTLAVNLSIAPLSAPCFTFNGRQRSTMQVIIYSFFLHFQPFS